MRTVFKWLGRAVVAVVMLAVLAGLVGYVSVTSTIPAGKGAAALPGLSATARAVRDRHAVPHVEAATYEDAVRTLGFVHAQDRFWQMHVLRMVAQGRLSELFGEPTVTSDVFLRTVDIAGASRASFDALPERAKTVLTAYAEGVNAWLSRPRGLMETQLPPEFLILGVPAEPWEPWQSVAMLKVMALTLDSNMEDEIKRLALAARGFTNAEIDELMPYSPRDNPPAMPDLRQLYGFGPNGKQTAEKAEPAGSRYAAGLVWPTGVDASNNWVVAGSRTASGKPLLANDPHLGLTAPSVFYLAHLSFEHEGSKRDVIGASLPGTPLILAGRTGEVAWGLTTTNLDGQDIFLERLDPDRADHYLTPSGSEAFGVATVEIKVSGKAEPHVFERRTTRHGPVLPEGYRSLKDILPPAHVAALSWASLATDDTTAEAAIRLNLSRTMDEALAATRFMIAPMQSIVFADSGGRTGLIAPGRVPLRDPANAVIGRAPVPGWLAEYDWKGFMAPEGVPTILDPQAGALATANANWMPQGYSGHITFDWDEHFRQARVEELVISATAPHSMETMRAIQLDKFSPALAKFRDAALAQLAPGVGQDPAMLAALREWNGLMDADKAEPLILTAWWRHAEIALFRDDLGDDFSRFSKGYMTQVLTALTTPGARDWCDDRGTETAENCGMALSKSFAAAMEELRAAQGNDWKAWRWGAAHVAFGEHRPFSSVEALSSWFTIERPSHGGSYTLLRGRTDFGEDKPYRNVHASAYRGIYDLSDPNKSLYVISTGQSGHFLSAHYDDMADVWAGLEYIPMTTDPAQYGEQAKGAWEFRPQ